ncbi:Disease resistance RPP8-like protein 3 [Triticum urartu]|uniref:Disease resistance RPP8-like protein 3 n=2 Tax=Triticum urartu TaxID=4572 RepID=M7Z130_TRIUA|nr:disease resistance protein RGA5-like [Triticum urartu]EMS53151.1 Disease resistance RPP8-like protein 3 [Triticum urartu]
MAMPIVSAAAGVMNPLIGKLTTLMGDEYKKLKGVRKEVTFLKHELSAMNASLEKLEFMEKLEPNTKNWRDHVREMAYDMENCIDDFMQDLGGADAKPSAGFVKRTVRRLKTLRVRHRIAGQIEELKALAVEANERRIRYKIDDCNTSCGSVDIDPRISVMYKDAAGLVGTDGPKKEIVSLLTVTEKKLKVVSIVGFGGLGKTTLANQVYDDLEGQFDCKAFIPVSQKPDMPRLLNSLSLKLGINESSGICEVEDIIGQLREHLADKRYFIIVDDLWGEEAWDIIRCAFPENGNGSRVIVTTRVEAVAISACSNHYEHIYKMKPLSSEDSRKLFTSRVFGSENKCPSNFEEVSNEILKKCGGLPLAIITIASLLASRRERSRSDWENIKNSLGAQFAINPTLKGMRSILNLSYMNLPLHLRTCFLYLGMYPEDYEIQRDDLVRKWIAEGFVSNLHGANLEDVGISYFNELVNRSLIQHVMTYNGVCCKVHDMMLDLILSKCAEDNFSSVAYTSKEMTRLPDCTYKIRRLSLMSIIDRTTNETISWTVSDSTSQVRSLVWFGACKSIPRLSQLKHIRVLSFEYPGSPQRSHLDLTAISQLFQLRYLKVSWHFCAKLPTEVRGLVHLDTLDVVKGGIPSDIVHLPRLSNLIMSYCGLPERIGIMESLRTLRGFKLQRSSLEAVEGLGKLTNLRSLELHTWDGDRCNPLEKAKFDAFASSICKLRNLKYLQINGNHDDKDDILGSVSDPPALIEEMYLISWKILRVPKWIGDVNCLHSLELSVRGTKTDEITILGGLPSLVYLKLRVATCPKEEAVIVSKGLFPVLERLTFISDEGVLAYLDFEAGAMPKLRDLSLQVNQLPLWGGPTPAGMLHLLDLQQISFTAYGNHEESFGQVKLEIQSAFRNALQLHPSPPSLDINCHTWSVKHERTTCSEQSAPGCPLL